MAFPTKTAFTFNHSAQQDVITPGVYTPTQLKTNLDSRSQEMLDFVNSILAALVSTTSGSSGAKNIGATAITSLSGTDIQTILESLRNALKSTTFSASGADFVAAAAITGLTGGTVQALLEALKGYIDTHKTSGDHDGRYFTETELQATTDGASGADKTGATQIVSGSGATVQAILRWLYLQITNVALGTIPDGSLTEVKLATAFANKIPQYAADVGSTDAYAVTLSPAPAAYFDGMIVRFKANTANTGAASLTVNSLGTIAIKKNVTSDLETGDVLANQPVDVIYIGGNFHMLSRSSILYLPLAGGNVTGNLRVTNISMGQSGTSFAFNRDGGTGAIFNATGHAYQWQRTLNTTPTSDTLDLQIYGPTGTSINSAAIRIDGNGTFFVNGSAYRSGTGSPEGVVTGIVGDLFMRKNGGAATTLYVKESGTGNTGWVAK